MKSKFGSMWIALTASFAALMFLTFSVPVNAQDNWHPTNQVTVAWDAVTTLSNGNPVPALDSVSYRIYTQKVPDGTITFRTEIVEIEYALTFDEEGRYLAGISSVRTVAGEEDMDPIESSISWSNNADVVGAPGTFGIQHYMLSSSPVGLVVQ